MTEDREKSGAELLAEDIWKNKYKFSADNTVEDTMRRVAKACASTEDESIKAEICKDFESILIPMKFLPGGRIISNAGTDRTKTTSSNCYVMGTIEDSMNSIFDTVKEAALTQQQGGGVGYDFSTIRPSGAYVAGCDSTASGPLSFMQIFDTMSKTVMSAGLRRAAQIAVLRCDHPDIEMFITAKRGNAAFNMFNLSVGVTNKFYEAVKNDTDWDLVFDGKVYKTIKASYLWDLIMRSNYDFAEPGVLLLDNVNNMNNLKYCETISSCNPCGEQCLPPYGACLLGSVNLVKFVNNPFTIDSSINYHDLRRTVTVAVRLLDNVIDNNNYPLPQQKEEALSKRRMGIGITGLADVLIMMGIKYGSDRACTLSKDLMLDVTLAAYEASIKLARERGPFPKFDADKYIESEFIKKLDVASKVCFHKDSGLISLIKNFGIRNSHLTSIAPTGTISLLAGNVSSGLEPVFDWKYNRKIRTSVDPLTMKDVTKTVEIQDYAYTKFMELGGTEDELPNWFVTADQVSPENHIRMQACLQEYVDSSISKTINCPADISFDKFVNIYDLAFTYGLKGCTTFRPSEQITGILTKIDDKPKSVEIVKERAPKDTPTIVHVTDVEWKKRPVELEGKTYKIKPVVGAAIYVTINDRIDAEGKRHPYEIFINTKDLQSYSWLVATSRVLSAVFRLDPDPLFIVDELISIHDPQGGFWENGTYKPSVVAALGEVIKRHILGSSTVIQDTISEVEKPKEINVKKSGMLCPNCNQYTLKKSEGCTSCNNCGYSKCS